MSKIALITVIAGQDGSCLAEFLLEKGYIVHGIKLRSFLFNTDRIDHIYQDPHANNKNLHLLYGYLSDTSNLTRSNLFELVNPGVKGLASLPARFCKRL
jgi:GDPmannose 4,6-dehydratase